VAVIVAMLGVIVLTRSTRPGVQRGQGEAQSGDRAQALTSRELAEIAERATVELRVGTSLGAGFFVEPDLVVTNAHVVGEGSDQVEVLFSDGRALYGRRERVDAWLDVALVRVESARSVPLPIGDATRLRRGDQVMIMGNPRGLDFTFAQGIVSHPSRCLMGITYLQLDASIHPGNSGGPVLDTSGRVVGIVSMMVGSSSGLGLALPINYLLEEVPPFLTTEAPELDHEAWRERLAEAAEAERREIAELRTHLQKPGLVGAFLAPPGVVTAVVVQWSEFPPGLASFAFSLARRGQTLCLPMGEVQSWGRVEDAGAQVRDTRYFIWLERNGLTREAYAGVVPLRMDGCPDPSSVLGATLTLDGGDPTANRAVVQLLMDDGTS
jgi:serine protease Do